MYKTHAESDSMYNTPPCYSIYMQARFGMAENASRRAEGDGKAQRGKKPRCSMIFSTAQSFLGLRRKESRSIMNVTFVTGDKDLDAKFVQGSCRCGL